MKNAKQPVDLADEIAKLKVEINKALIVPPPTKPDRNLSDALAQRVLLRAHSRAERRKALESIMSPGSPAFESGKIVEVKPPEIIKVPVGEVQSRGRGR